MTTTNNPTASSNSATTQTARKPLPIAPKPSPRRFEYHQGQQSNGETMADSIVLVSTPEGRPSLVTYGEKSQDYMTENCSIVVGSASSILGCQDILLRRADCQLPAVNKSEGIGASHKGQVLPVQEEKFREIRAKWLKGPSIRSPVKVLRGVEN